MKAPRNDPRRRNERSWSWAPLVLSVLAAAGWGIARTLRGSAHPGDPVGLFFGGAATALLLLAALYGVRRRAMARVSRWRLGSARRWLRWHLQGGVLFLVAVALHTGTAAPAGVLSWSLWLLAVWTVATGLLGYALQRTIPRVLTARSGLEVLYERIPELVAELRQRAEELVATEQTPLRVFYRNRLAPVLAAPHRDPLVLLGGGADRRRLEPLEHLRSLLPAAERARLETLESLVHAKLDLDVHYTLQQALRGWLWLHLPPAALLLVLVAVHVATVLYY
jgi:hypothetical protein